MKRQEVQQVVKSNWNCLKLTISSYNHKWANESETFEDLQLLRHKPTSSSPLSTITSRSKNGVKHKLKAALESQKSWLNRPQKNPKTKIPLKLCRKAKKTIFSLHYRLSWIHDR